MKKLSLLACILALCAGCMSLNAKPIEENVERSIIYEKDYTIGKQITAYIGQPMVRWQEILASGGSQVYIVFQDDFRLNFNYVQAPVPIPRNCIVVGKKGYESETQFMAEYDGKKYFIIEQECDTGTVVGLLIDEDGKLNTSIVADSGPSRGYKMEDVTLLPPTPHFTRHIKPNKQDMQNGITHELIFGGVNNVSINVTYREYTPNNMARQAFYQNVIYQTSAEIIRFQGFKIKVHEVTNEKIVLTILEDGLDVPTTQHP